MHIFSIRVIRVPKFSLLISFIKRNVPPPAGQFPNQTSQSSMKTENKKFIEDHLMHIDILFQDAQDKYH
jgi:hypothetical protein